MYHPLLIDTYYYHISSQSLYSNYGSPPISDPQIKNKWTNKQTKTEAGTQSSFCSPLDCASLWRIIDTLGDKSQASPSRALGAWVTHVDGHKRHSSHRQQCTSRSSNNVLFFRCQGRFQGLWSVAWLHVACQQSCPLTWTGKPHWGLISWHVVTHMFLLLTQDLSRWKGDTVLSPAFSKRAISMLFHHFSNLPVSFIILQSCQYCVQSADVVSFPAFMSLAAVLLPLCISSTTISEQSSNMKSKRY